VTTVMVRACSPLGRSRAHRIAHLRSPSDTAPTSGARRTAVRNALYPPVLSASSTAIRSASGVYRRMSISMVAAASPAAPFTLRLAEKVSGAPMFF
jgi:hypothetical protein